MTIRQPAGLPRKLLAGLAGVLSGIAISALLLALRPAAGPVRVTIVSDCAGALAAVEMHFASDALPQFRAAQADILRALSPATAVSIVCADENEWRLFQQFAAEEGIPPAMLRPVFTRLPITPWAHDRYVPGRTGSDRVFLAPLPEPVDSEKRRNEFIVPDLLAASCGGAVVRPQFRFDGGDFTASAGILYAGSCLVPKNSGGRFGRAPVLRAELETLTGMRVILLGESDSVPAHHIGMFVAPLDEHTVLLADPLLARAAMGDSVVLPYPGADFSPAVLARFANLRRELTDAGLRVVGLPAVPFVNPAVYLTYNNVLIEERAGRKMVLMPVYDVPELDNAARRIYEEQGFAVKEIRVAKVFQLGGSVRCLINVISRGE